MTKNYTRAIVCTAVSAVLLIAAMAVAAFALFGYADAQWTKGLYFYDHQEYICTIGDEVAEFNFMGICVGEKETLPSPEDSVCSLGGVEAESFRFYCSDRSGRFTSVQLTVFVHAPQSFTATEVMFAQAGVETAYEIGTAVYDRAEGQEAEGLTLSYSWAIGTGRDLSCVYSVDIVNGFDDAVAIDAVRLEFPYFENFIFSQGASGEITLPLALEGGASATLNVHYEGGDRDSAVILQPVISYTLRGTRYLARAKGANVYFDTKSADAVIALIKERNERA